MGADWIPEAFKDNFALVFEQESFADAQLGNRIRYQDLFCSRVSAETGGQLNCHSKQIVMLLDWFPRRGADSHFERAVRLRLLMFGQFALNLNCASNRAR